MLATKQKIHIANVFTRRRFIRFELAFFYVVRTTRWQHHGISTMASGNELPDLAAWREKQLAFQRTARLR
jgi:hypothetical protein